MSVNQSVGWETVGGAGKPIKKSGSSEKQVAKKEAEAKKKFAEKAPKIEDVRKLMILSCFIVKRRFLRKNSAFLMFIVNK